MMIEKVIHWGPGAPRRKSKSAVRQAFALNRKPWVCDQFGHATIPNGGGCPTCGCRTSHRRRIFSLSLGDWLDPEVPIEWLAEMLNTIRLCDACDWLLLTKRPERFADALSATARIDIPHALGSAWIDEWLDGNPPHNVWLGTSVEDQERADERIPHLLKIPAKVRFLSMEPLLEPVEVGRWLNAEYSDGWPANAIHWIIIGGESGTSARPCNVEWIRSIKDQCAAAGVACFVKQLGSRPVCDCSVAVGSYSANCCEHFPLPIHHPKGGDPSEWPEDLRVQQFPSI